MPYMRDVCYSIAKQKSKTGLISEVQSEVSLGLESLFICLMPTYFYYFSDIWDITFKNMLWLEYFLSVNITLFITRSLSIFLQSMLFLSQYLKTIYLSNLPTFLLPNSVICAAASANPFIHVGTTYTLPYIPNSFGFVQHLPNCVIHFLTAWE